MVIMPSSTREKSVEKAQYPVDKPDSNRYFFKAHSLINKLFILKMVPIFPMLAKSAFVYSKNFFGKF